MRTLTEHVPAPGDLGVALIGVQEGSDVVWICGWRPYTKEFWYQEPRTSKLLANAADAWIPLRMT
jgi:hypothetical protein